jgi:hypothetical protein
MNTNQKKITIHMALGAFECIWIICAFIIPPLPGPIFWTYLAWLAVAAVAALMANIGVRIVENSEKKK